MAIPLPTSCFLQVSFFYPNLQVWGSPIQSVPTSLLLPMQPLPPPLDPHPSQLQIPLGLTLAVHLCLPYCLLTLANCNVVDEHIAEELRAGQLVGPLPPQLAQFVHCNPMGLVSKAYQIYKWRLIVDLNFPRGHSVNDRVDPDLSTIRYSSINDMVRLIQQMGQGSHHVKVDLKNTY